MTRLRSPLQFDASGRTATVDPATHVRGLIEQLLLTSPGERLRRPDFGSGLFHAVFDPAGADLAVALQDLAQAALDRWLGDLITVEAVEVRADDATLRVDVQYVLRATGERRQDSFTAPGGAP